MRKSLKIGDRVKVVISENPRIPSEFIGALGIVSVVYPHSLYEVAFDEDQEILPSWKHKHNFVESQLEKI